MGNCAQPREGESKIEKKAKQGLKHFYPTFEIGLSEEEIEQNQNDDNDKTINYNDGDYFDKSFARDQGQDYRNIIKIQELRLPYFNNEQLMIEVGYGVNFQIKNFQIRISCYPNRFENFTTKQSDQECAFFEIFRCKDSCLEGNDTILFEVIVDQKIVSYSQLPMVCLMDQKVKEIKLDFMSPTDGLYERGQIKPLRNHDHKLWVRVQYVFNVQELHEQQKKQLRAFRIINDI